MTNALRTQFRILALAAAAVWVISGARAQAQDSNQNSTQASAQSGARTDGQIEMDVVQALDGSAALKNDMITAATIQGTVTLAGTVASDSDRRLAESIVAKVSGVTKVQNNLKVGNPADDPNAMGAAQDNTAPPVADDQQPAGNDQQQPNPEQPPANGQQGPNLPPRTPGQGTTQQPGYAQPGYAQPGYGQQPPPQQPGYGQQPPYAQQPGYPPPPPGYGPPPPGYRQPYAPAPPRYATATAPLTVPAGTVLQLRTNDSLSEKKAQDGQPVDFTVIRDVTLNGYLAIPRGATVHGVVSEVKHSGTLTGTPELALRLTSLDIDGRTYPLDSDQFKVRGPSKTGRTVGNAVGGALLGAIIGGAAGGGGGAAIGAAAGGGAGTAVSAAGSPHAWIPAEALVVFHLNSPVTVDPVTREQATRLAQGLYQGGPALYRRPGYYYGPGYYPPVYYRPYYFSGGYYYWR